MTPSPNPPADPHDESVADAPGLAAGADALAGLAARERFVEALGQALAAGQVRRIALSRPVDRADDLQRVSARPLVLRGEPCISFVFHHRTRDITRNESPAEARETVAALAGTRFGHAHLLTADAELQLLASRKGRLTFHARRLAGAAAPAPRPAGHDRAKRRLVPQEAPFLQALGVTDERHQVIPAMARKWRQINKFVEIVAHALQDAGLDAAAPLRVVDFGAGKGYLTFALHDWLVRAGGGSVPDVVGVELREELVRQANEAAARCRLAGLRFEAGDIATHATGAVDVMIALHACDTATDLAIHAGIRCGASVIVCSPCCHKQLRPQLQAPSELAGLLRHGIHLGQEAEMLTDSLRALLLQAEGYEAQVFEFVALEHTSKNKMILAVARRGADPRRREEALAQVAELKRFYGVREQCLESLLAASGRPQVDI